MQLILEIRDRMTFIPVVVNKIIPTTDQEMYLFRRAGWDFSTIPILVTNLVSGDSKINPFDWGGRTMEIAHKFISENIEDIQPGMVIDVEYILGESTEPKVSEREEY